MNTVLVARGAGVAWPRSLRCDASLVPHLGIGPSGADISDWAGAGATMSVHCDGTLLAQLAAEGLRAASFKGASTAIPGSIRKNRECHADPGPYVFLSAACWF
jgi:hypothetical protein